MRLRVVILGAVQGVGFRPFVYRLATELGLSGWVNNSSQGVFIEAEGPREVLDQFLIRLQAEPPPRSFIQSLEPTWLDAAGFQGFEIRKSDAAGEKLALILPDIATCPECLREILDPSNRRHLYPFTNCTHCGPRFSIIEALPYDRPNTSMKGFTMCDECRAEYEDPASRRFHAQPNACPKCGPQLELWASGHATSGHEALCAAAKAIVEGAIVAVKGLGGFHLLCLASDDAAVGRLRDRKHREEKPFAVMFPSGQSVHEHCEVSPLEERLLNSPEAPIVLLRQRRDGVKESWSDEPKDQCHPSLHYSIAPSVNPGNPWLGVLLPYTPLHHLLLREIGMPVVATSGNLSDEPICTDEHDAVERLAEIADLFLVHNRPIVRHVDDSIVRVVAGREMVLRRARGYAPLPVTLGSAVRNPQSAITLGVGAHLKNAVALSMGAQVFVSQHIGDLETEAAWEAFQRVVADLQRLYGVNATQIVSDAHPDYLSTRFARDRVAQASLPAVSEGVPASSGLAPSVWPGNSQAGSLRHVEVQHHVAHVLSCMAENELDAPVLGVSWDGTGYGLDGTVWGGEFIQITRRGEGLEWHRAAHLRQFRLPGGEQAVKEPRRCALGLLHEFQGGTIEGLAGTPAEKAFQPAELSTLARMLERGLNSPLTSSMGRLFDAVAALTGLRQFVRHEGQAAMALEFAAEGVETEEAYALPIANRQSPTTGGRSPTTAGQWMTEQPGASSTSSRNTQHATEMLDWKPMIEAVLADARMEVPVALISARFHNALAEAIVAMAKRVGLESVVLSGGCFQNRRLLERAIARLRQGGFRPYWHQRVPTNDGGIALGQVASVLWNLKTSSSGSHRW